MAGVDEAAVGEVGEGVVVGGEVVELCDWAGVVVEAEPGECVECLLGGVWFDAWAVEIFDAHGDVPGVLPGEGPVDEESAGVAEMEGAGG